MDALVSPAEEPHSSEFDGWSGFALFLELVRSTSRAVRTLAPMYGLVPQARSGCFAPSSRRIRHEPDFPARPPYCSSVTNADAPGRITSIRLYRDSNRSTRSISRSGISSGCRHLGRSDFEYRCARSRGIPVSMRHTLARRTLVWYFNA